MKWSTVSILITSGDYAVSVEDMSAMFPKLREPFSWHTSFRGNTLEAGTRASLEDALEAGKAVAASGAKPPGWRDRS